MEKVIVNKENIAQKNILVVLAHMDDEIYTLGMIRKLKETNANIYLLTVCGNGFKLDDDRLERENIYNSVHREFFTKATRLEYYDTTLGSIGFKEESAIKENIDFLINKYNICTVITHYHNDIHQDHKKVSELVQIVCRPHVSRVKKLLGCFIPGNHQELDKFNIVVDVTYDIDIITKFAKDYKRLRFMPGRYNTFHFSDSRATELYHLYYEKL